MQRDVLKSKLAIGIDRDRYFLDGTGAVIAAGLDQPHFRWIGLARFDKKVVGDAESLALLERGDVILPVLVDTDCSFVNIALATVELDLLVIQHKTAIGHRAIRENFEIRVRALDSA